MLVTPLFSEVRKAMNFSELRDEVALLVRRPDLTDRINSAIKAATLKVHHSDFYYKDLHEQSVEFTTPAYIQNFLPTDVFAQFRKAKYIRVWEGDAATGTFGRFFQFIQVENSRDAYGCEKTDVFYQAGQLLQMRGRCQIDKILFGAYVHPVITPENEYCSWIAKEMPWTIIYEAARTIFRSIGRDQEAGEMTQLFGEQLNLLKMSYIDDAPMT